MNYGYFECKYCGGEVEFEYSDRGDVGRINADCEPACANHPDINPTALFDAAEDKLVSMAEAAWERQYADYHGGSGPQTLTELVEESRKQQREWRGELPR